MRIVGKDMEPLDFSRETHKDVFLQSLEKWREDMKDNPTGKKYGYFDIVAMELKPYGIQYA
jgi:hypothetical protein